MARSAQAGAFVVLVAALSGCAGAADTPTDDAPPAVTEPQVLEIATSDYAFTGPDTVAAGWVTLRMTAGGNELHHVQVVRLDEGHTFQEFTAELAKGEGPPPAGHTCSVASMAPIPAPPNRPRCCSSPGTTPSSARFRAPVT